MSATRTSVLLGFVLIISSNCFISLANLEFDLGKPGDDESKPSGWVPWTGKGPQPIPSPKPKGGRGGGGGGRGRGGGGECTCNCNCDCRNKECDKSGSGGGGGGGGNGGGWWGGVGGGGGEGGGWGGVGGGGGAVICLPLPHLGHGINHGMGSPYNMPHFGGDRGGSAPQEHGDESTQGLNITENPKHH